MDINSTKVLMIKALAAIGLAVTLYKLTGFLRFVASTFLLPGQKLSKFRKAGSWAVVTGASEGIGREYALQLANAGFNICLCARTGSKLEKVAAEIEKRTQGKVRTQIQTIDFCSRDDAVWETFAAELAKLEQNGGVSVLINNVGLSHDKPVPFQITSKEEMTRIIDLNCHSTLRTTQIVVNLMANRDKKPGVGTKGLILTMSSFAGIIPTPLLATYAGSKSFLTAWSTALGAELEAQGIVVDCVQSYLVTSNMSKIKHASLMIPRPDQFARAALGKIGLEAGSQGLSYNSTPYWSHAVFQWVVESSVGRFSRIVLSLNLKMHKDIRVRALKKEQRLREAVATGAENEAPGS